MYWAAAPARTTTRNNAAWTTLRDRTTPIAAPPIATAKSQKATCCSHTALLLTLRLGTNFEWLRFRDGLHPLPELDLVVEHVRDLKLRVLVLGAPEQGVEGAHLDADPAVHAQRIVDVEAVEHAHRPGAATFSAWGSLLLVPFDVDAPIRALACAQHADGAVFLLEGDDPPSPRRGGFLLVRVLHRHRGAQHGLERHSEPADEAGNLGFHQSATLKMPASKMLASPSGMRNFQAKACSWSSRSRGYVNRTQNMRNATIISLANSTTGQRMLARSPWTPGMAQPPRNRVAAIAENANAVPNSPMKKNRNRNPVYSTM